MAIAKDATLTSGAFRGVTGKLERAKFNAYTTETTGAATVGTAIDTLNKDGGGLRLNMAAGTTVPGAAVVRDIVWGRVVGVRWSRDTTTTNIAPFDVVIDGIAYPVDAVKPLRDNSPVVVTDSECFAIIATNLPDAEHTVEVHLTAVATGSKNLAFLGWIAEGGRGYTAAPATPVSVLPSAVTLGTSAASISASGAITALRFTNTDAAARVVTVANSSAAVIWTKSIAAGSTEVVAFNGAFRPTTPWTWKADAASVVTAFVEQKA